jgi:protein tyrosine phosphatase (PTP) superfamily phosphohydrolase (DUF442 family)
MRHFPAAPTLALSLLLAAACADVPVPAAEEASAPAPPSQTPAGPSLATARSLEIPNVGEPLPNLLTAGGLTPEGMAALVEAGYSRFISLRSPDEEGSGWEEDFAAASGIAFQRIAVPGPAGVTRENVEALDALLDEGGDEATVLYCASSNRVGALLALRAHWLDGVGPDSALALGRAAGMTGLEPLVTGLMAN